MSKYIIRLKFHHLKKKKNLFLQIPHRPTLWDGEEFKMGPSPPPPPPSPQRDKGRRKGERIEIITKMLVMIDNKNKKIVILTQVHLMQTTEAYYPIFFKVKIRAYKG